MRFFAMLGASLSLVLVALLFFTESTAPADASAAVLSDTGSGLHVAKTRHMATASGTGNLTYHGGRVMQSSSTSYAIFWEPPTLQTGAPTHVSATYNSLIQRYFGDVGGNGLYKNNTQYYQVVSGVTQFIVNKSSFGSAWVDTSAYPASGCVDTATPGNCVSDAQIHAEVVKAMSANGWTGGLKHEFFVFTSYGEGSCASGTSCAFTAYCAYHGHFTSNSQTVLYANMPYTGTSLQGCGVSQSPNNDFDADSTINVTSHEQMETVTDPRLNAWYDSSGEEIGDKCAWVFGTLSLDGGKANEEWNGHFYILQEEWDNKVSGCVQTGP